MQAAFLRSVPERLFALDTRSLALFRLGLGLLVLYDASARLPDVAAFYSETGAVPHAVVHELNRGGPGGSLHMLHGSTAYAGALLVLQALAGLALLVGYHTRLAIALCFLLTLSVHQRNPLLLNWGDVILRLLLLWSLFLPLAERVSLDRRLGAPRATARSFLGLGSAGFVIQLGCIYFFSALLKTGEPWQDGTAVAIALSHDFSAKLPQAAIALEFPRVLAFLTHTVRPLEAVGPLLLLVPVAQVPLRMAVIVGFWSFHLGLAAFLALGIFPWVCIVAWCALIPGPVWDRVGLNDGGGPRVLRRRQWPALAVIALVLASNLGTLQPGASIHPLLRESLRLTGLQQKWSMFAPKPIQNDDGWLVVVGRLDDGREVDLVRGGNVSWSKPTDITVQPQRWRTYLRAVWRRRPMVRDAYANWLCRGEGAGTPEAARVEHVTLYFVREETPQSENPVGIRPFQIWDGSCGNSPGKGGNSKNEPGVR